jgi:hypothetical protein
MREWRYNSTILHLSTRRRWVVRFTPWPLYPRVLFGYEAAWAPEPVWTLWEREISCPARIRTPAVQPAGHPYSDWSLSSHNFLFYSSFSQCWRRKVYGLLPLSASIAEHCVPKVCYEHSWDEMNLRMVTTLGNILYLRWLRATLWISLYTMCRRTVSEWQSLLMVQACLSLS